MTATTVTTAAAPTTSTTSTTTSTSATTERAGRTSRRFRAACVAAAVVTNSALFLGGKAAGAEFVIASPGHEPAPFHLAEIAGVTLVISLIGWACFALLERFTRHAHAVWCTLATAVVLVSLPPIWMVEATAGTRALLVAIHVAVGVALAPMTRRPS